jgi:hypothetical protein
VIHDGYSSTSSLSINHLAARPTSSTIVETVFGMKALLSGTVLHHSSIGHSIDIILTAAGYLPPLDLQKIPVGLAKARTSYLE